MNIQSEKLRLIEWIAQLKDESILQQLNQIMDDLNLKSTTELSSEEKKSIERGIKDIESGKSHPHEEVRKIYEKYL